MRFRLVKKTPPFLSSLFVGLYMGLCLLSKKKRRAQFVLLSFAAVGPVEMFSSLRAFESNFSLNSSVAVWVNCYFFGCCSCYNLDHQSSLALSTQVDSSLEDIHSTLPAPVTLHLLLGELKLQTTINRCEIAPSLRKSHQQMCFDPTKWR